MSTMTETETKTETCQHCGAKIYLVPTGNHFKWVTNPHRPTSWNCTVDPDRPVLSHAPSPSLSPNPSPQVNMA